jgi:hypothetical protein
LDGKIARRAETRKIHGRQAEQFMLKVDKKIVLFHSIFIVFSILIAFGVSEIVLRSISLSSGAGGGRLGARWLAENWKPTNSLNYRDYEPTGTHEKDSVLFVGDSFTAGYGVKFTETFYYIAKGLLHDKYESFNVGRAGASTRTELKHYLEYKEKYKIVPNVVVLQ